MKPAIATPCVQHCKLDPTEGFCLGCFRTLGEVAGWGSLAPEQRRAVMAELPARRQRYHMVGSHITISGT
jgi:predicted Fe-S protein YdhL (DUF1289 family)